MAQRFQYVVRALTKLDFEAPLEAMAQFLDEETMQSLAMASFLLHTLRPEPQPSADQLDEIAESLSQLRAEVVGGGADPKLKAYLLEHLHEMLRAVDLVRVGGPGVLEAASERAVGGLVARPELRAQANHPFAKRFFLILSHVLVVLQVLQAGTELVSWAAPSLPPGDEKPTIVVVPPGGQDPSPGTAPAPP